MGLASQVGSTAGEVFAPGRSLEDGGCYDGGGAPLEVLVCEESMQRWAVRRKGRTADVVGGVLYLYYARYVSTFGIKKVLSLNMMLMWWRYSYRSCRNIRVQMWCPAF